VPADGYSASDAADEDAVGPLADQVRETIQDKIDQLVAERGPAFG
jgi:hypothetical protein